MSAAPIVLVHGIFGFGRLGVAGLSIEYFRDIPAALRAAGHTVPDPPSLSAAGSVVERAAGLQRYLNTEPSVRDRRVHLIAHSMGGLDARWMISKLGMADRVLSLTTIGTPHHGTPVADDANTIRELAALLTSAGIDLRGLDDLTTSACERFNAEVSDAPGVGYFAIAGRYEPPRVLGFPVGILAPTHHAIREVDGPNDGLVSMKSATFVGRPGWSVLEEWPANHFRLVNWGTNVIPTPSEAADTSIVERYQALAARSIG